METFYTLIKIAPNPMSGDSISIGLLVRDSNKFWIQFSDDKKSLAKKLLDKKSEVVDLIVKQFIQEIGLANDEIKAEQIQLFNLHNFMDSKKISHMSNYFNGIVRFSPPLFLNDSLDQDKFEKLFKLLIDKNFSKEKDNSDTGKQAFQDRIESKLIKRVENKVHTNLYLTSKELPGLYYNFNIDCIGKNGSLIGAKSISFDKSYETIDKDLSHYLALIPLLKSKYPSTSNDEFYVIADEPTGVSSREHKLWVNLSQNPSILLLNSDESGKVADEIEEHQAKPFLQLFNE